MRRIGRSGAVTNVGFDYIRNHEHDGMPAAAGMAPGRIAGTRMTTGGVVTKRFPAGVSSRIADVSAVREPDFDWSWAEDGLAWVSPAVDTRRPSIARFYDFALGGKDNYGIDRELAQRVYEVVPDAGAMARSNRGFVLRAIRVMAEAGIRQFLDLGCGIPSEPTVHEIARDIHPDARVVYIDHDPIVLAQSRALLDGQSGLYAALHDLREPARVLADPALREIIRLDEPVGLVLGSVLHFVDLSIGVQVVSHYISKIAPGSHVAFSVATNDGASREVTQTVEQIFRSVSSPIAFRTTAQIDELMDGLELLPPGLTDVTRWRADGDPGTLRLHAGVAFKR